MIGQYYDKEDPAAEEYYSKLGYKKKKIEEVNAAFGEIPYRGRPSFRMASTMFHRALERYIKDNQTKLEGSVDF